uniref:Uncharacterized protein n=1 Tax=Urocitellus parryii TaxID=9999 RepID=A0A8D2HTX4_UROPR
MPYYEFGLYFIIYTHTHIYIYFFGGVVYQRLNLVGIGEALALNTSSLFPAEAQRASGSIIPIYYALLATVVLSLWHSYKQRQQLTKARTAELVGFDRDQRHGDNSIFLDSPSGLESCATNQEPHPDFGCQLYLHLP